MHVEAFAVNRSDGEADETLVCEFDRTALSLKRDA
jgi:hypothetical protein